MAEVSFSTGMPSLEEAVRLLSQTDWAANRSAESTDSAMRNSLCVCGYDSEGKLVAFARLVTDHTLYAYLADVVVEESLRGTGIGKALMAYIMELELVKSLRRFALITGDAHTFYERYGFVGIDPPEDYRQIFRK